MLAHDLRHRQRLPARVDRLVRPLLGMLLNGGIGRGAEGDPLALDVVAREGEAPDPERDDDDPEGHQQAARDVAADP